MAGTMMTVYHLLVAVLHLLLAHVPEEAQTAGKPLAQIARGKGRRWLIASEAPMRSHTPYYRIGV